MTIPVKNYPGDPVIFYRPLHQQLFVWRLHSAPFGPGLQVLPDGAIKHGFGGGNPFRKLRTIGSPVALRAPLHHKANPLSAVIRNVHFVACIRA
jgi:hypothetical protein